MLEFGSKFDIASLISYLTLNIMVVHDRSAGIYGGFYGR